MHLGTTAIDYSTLKLSPGAHRYRWDGTCLMEAIASLAGEFHTAFPSCVDAAVGIKGRITNDYTDDDGRKRLVELIPAIMLCTPIRDDAQHVQVFGHAHHASTRWASAERARVFESEGRRAWFVPEAFDVVEQFKVFVHAWLDKAIELGVYRIDDESLRELVGAQ